MQTHDPESFTMGALATTSLPEASAEELVPLHLLCWTPSDIIEVVYPLSVCPFEVYSISYSGEFSVLTSVLDPNPATPKHLDDFLCSEVMFARNY